MVMVSDEAEFVSDPVVYGRGGLVDGGLGDLDRRVVWRAVGGERGECDEGEDGSGVGGGGGGARGDKAASRAGLDWSAAVIRLVGRGCVPPPPGKSWYGTAAAAGHILCCSAEVGRASGRKRGSRAALSVGGIESVFFAFLYAAPPYSSPVSMSRREALPGGESESRHCNNVWLSITRFSRVAGHVHTLNRLASVTSPVKRTTAP